MFLSKFIYDLLGHPKPDASQLNDDIDRLLFLQGVETPDYLYKLDERDSKGLDSEVLSHWIRRRFEPALLLLLLTSEDNHHLVKSELIKMESFQNRVDRFFRYDFVHNHATQRVKELCSDNINYLKINVAILRLKKTITFLAKHIEHNGPNLTLLGTDTYTPADVILYNYLKRILVGKYKDMGLKSHVRLCDSIIKFMSRYAKKNRYVIDVSSEDPLANPKEENTLIADMAKPVVIALSVILFYVWRRERFVSLTF